MANGERSAQRADMDTVVRIRLLETDMDKLEKALERQDARLESIQRSVAAGVISLIVGALLLAANLAVGL